MFSQRTDSRMAEETKIPATAPAEGGSASGGENQPVQAAEEAAAEAVKVEPVKADAIEPGMVVRVHQKI